MPTLCIGLRGLIYMEVEASGPARDLHSGLYGGAAPNAVFGLIELLAKVKSADGAIQIPGIYDDVEPPAAAEMRAGAGSRSPRRSSSKRKSARTALTGEPAASVLERVWARPTLEVHGIAGGFTGAGAKTVIPAAATAKVSIRLVPRQDPDKWSRAFKEFVQKNTPKGIRTEVRVLSAAPGVDGEPGSSGHCSGRQRLFRHFSKADRIHPFRRLNPDRRRFRHSSGHPDRPDGLRTAGRWSALAQ